MSNSAPIGIFDSGIGGLTVANAIKHYLPEEQIIYFGDTAHLPYGDKAPASIIEYSKRITTFLVDRGAKIVVIACNTASSIAFAEAVEAAGDVPVINVIDPVVAVAAQTPNVHKIGIIGTRATINSGEYPKRINALKPKLEVTSMATPLLVPLIEEHIMDEAIGKMVIEKYLSQPQLQGIDALILGCTHYPLVKSSMEEYYRGKVKVFDSADIVGKYVYNYVTDHHLRSDKLSENHHFYVSDFTESFEKNTLNFFGSEIHLEERYLWKSQKPGRV